MSVVAWGGRLWCFGGMSGECTTTLDPTGELFVLDPQEETLQQLDVRPDPGSMKRWVLL